MTRYMNEMRMGELFGLSFEEMDKILIEYGLKSGEFATQKAVDDGYAYYATSEPSNHWDPLKISELTGKKIVDEIGYYVEEVVSCIQIADELCYDRYLKLLTASQAYRDVPKDLWDEVQRHVDRQIIGDRRRACKKCGRMTFWRTAEDLCWRCNPNEPFVQQRLNHEAATQKVAVQLAASSWGTLYMDNGIEPKDTDMELWNRSVETAIDTFQARLINPSICDERVSSDIIYESIHGEVFTDFVCTGSEDYGDRKRCRAFLKLAYETVAGVLMNRAT